LPLAGVSWPEERESGTKRKKIIKKFKKIFKNLKRHKKY